MLTANARSPGNRDEVAARHGFVKQISCFVVGLSALLVDAQAATPEQEWLVRPLGKTIASAEAVGPDGVNLRIDGEQPPIYATVARPQRLSDRPDVAVVLRARASTQGQVRISPFLQARTPSGRQFWPAGLSDAGISSDRPASICTSWISSGEAGSVDYGFALRGSGSAEVRQIDVSWVAPETLGYTKAQPLRERGLGNLRALAKALGLIRFFYPDRSMSEVDWGAVAVTAVRSVEGSQDSARLQANLAAAFREIAPAATFTGPSTREHAQDDHQEATAKGEARFRWEHFGVDLGAGNIYRSGLVAAHESDPSSYVADLGDGVLLRLPLALPTIAATAVPRRSADADSCFEPSGNDRSTRLASVLLLWSTLYYFYPDADRAQIHWDALFGEFLTKAAEDRDQFAFLTTLRMLSRSLRDGHAEVRLTVPPRLPFAFEIIEEQVVVTQVGSEVRHIKRGDVLTAIDAIPVSQLVERSRKAVSASTPQIEKVRIAQRLPEVAEERRFEVSVRDAEGKSITESVMPQSRAVMPPDPRKEASQDLGDGTWYVDLNQLRSADIDMLVRTLTNAKSLVLDARGYPADQRAELELFAHLSLEALRSPQSDIVVRSGPQPDAIRVHSLQSSVPPAQPHLAAECYLLIDASTFSAAEYALGFLSRDRCTWVGSDSAGVDGNINTQWLPGGYQVTWTGMRMRNADGSLHNGAGFAPHVRVEKTIAALRQNEDSTLRTAIDLSRRSPK